MNHDQFTLPFLDTTIVAEGFGLYGGFPTAKSPAPVQMNLEPEEAEGLCHGNGSASRLAG
jgi:hypothetical protein